MQASFLEIWEAIEPPKNEGEKKAKEVPGTNCWISKSHDNSLGMIMTSVGQPRRIRPEEYLDRFQVRIRVIH